MVQLFCGYTGLFNFVFCLFFSLFVFLKNKKGLINRVFSWWSFNVAVWSLGYFIWLFTEKQEAALFWTRFLMAGAIIIPASFLHFTMVYISYHKTHKIDKYITTVYLFAAAYLLLDFTPLFIKTVEPRFWFRWWPVPGVLYHIYQIYFLAVVALCHYLLFTSAFRAKGVLRKQLMFVSAGTAIAYAGGSTNFFIWYNIPIPPIFNFLVVGYVALIMYAVLNYRLWDIEVVIKRTIVFTGLISGIYGVIATVALILRETMRFLAGTEARSFSLFISVLIIVLVYDPLRKLLVNLTDRFLFQKKFDYKELLKDASGRIALIQRFDHLVRLIVTFITVRARIKNAAIFICSDNETAFILRAQRGSKYAPEEQKFPAHHPLIAKIMHDRDVLQLTDFPPENELSSSNIEAIRSAMLKLKADVIIPSFLGKPLSHTQSKSKASLRSLLILGGKKSDEPYTDEDLGVFFALAQESAIAIENARLYDEQIKKARELADANGRLAETNQQLNDASTRLMQALNDTQKAKDELERTQAQVLDMKRRELVARMSAAMGHEIKNPLQGLSFTFYHFTSVRKLLDEILTYGREMKDDKIINLSTKLVSIIDRDIGQPLRTHVDRIKGIANSVTDLIKGQDRVSDIHLGLIINYAIQEIRFTTYWERLAEPSIEVLIPSDLPLVRANAHRLQGVFVNLIKNALDAMSRVFSVVMDVSCVMRQN